jgi:hypothetical protein
MFHSVVDHLVTIIIIAFATIKQIYFVVSLSLGRFLTLSFGLTFGIG